MEKQRTIAIVLKGKSGASFVFVLGIMLMLLAIGVSAIAAAGANSGIGLSQKEYNQIMVLDNSVHTSIMYSLQCDPSDSDFLSQQIAMALYNAHNPSNPEASLADMPLEIAFENGFELDRNNMSVDVTLSFPTQEVFVTNPVPAILPDIQREPKTATINATMTVTVTIMVNGRNSASIATYEYTGGMLSDDPDPSNLQHGDVETDEHFEMVFLPNGYGEWRLIKHEKADS